jgi:ABC-2 type transport system ATP-binding protein
MDNAIEIRGLHKRYPGFFLSDVSMDVPRGYIMGLIGPNGAGKTTLIRLLMGLARPDGGEIRIFGRDPVRYGADLRSRIGFVYETPCFPEDVTLGGIRAALAPFYRLWDQERFASLAGEFELPERKRFKNLSQGEQTKLALAVALSHHAELIIMDEPASGLDPVSRQGLLETLSEVMKDGDVTVLLSTHITTDLERSADFVTFLREGRVVFSAPKDEILSSWGIVRVGEEVLVPESVGLFRGVRRSAYGVQALTPDVERARAVMGRETVVERATLEDIMVFVEEGNHALEAHA